MELISVIVPVYNVADELPRCLDSILAQTYRKLEIILVDDGSSDCSGDLCDVFAERDKRVRVIHQRNMGVSEARNTGLKAASGSLIGFVDGDDWLDVEFYERLESCLRNNQAQVAMCGYYEYLPDEKRRLLIHKPDQHGVCGAEESLYRILVREGYFTSVWNKLYKRELIWNGSEMVAFDSTLAVGEDETWLIRVLRHVERASFEPSPLYHWGCRMQSATRKDTISDERMSILRSKQMAIELTRPYGERLTRLTKGRLLNDCHHLRVLAYRCNDTNTLRTIAERMKPTVWVWLLSSDVKLLRKIKVIFLEMLINCRAPVRWVDYVYDLKRSYAGKSRDNSNGGSL